MSATPNIDRLEAVIAGMGDTVNVSVQLYDKKPLWSISIGLGIAVGQGESLAEAIANVRPTAPPPVLDVAEIERIAA